MALYHTYRPQTFADVVGQEHIVATLKNQITKDNTAHAYLFSGPRGVGKTTSARLLAKAMNCTNRKADSPEPCGTCQSCTEISASRSIDVIEIDAASNTGVDHVREHIIENAQFRPTSSKYKIFIIDEVHMLSTSAFNALLKTLEEPPAHVMFVLATTELHKLPETIISRCQVYHFKKIPFATMKAYLEDIAKKESVEVEASVIERIIGKSDGCARDAVSLLDQIMATGEQKITADMVQLILPASSAKEVLQFITLLLEKKAESALEVIRDAENAGVNLSQFSYDTLEILRALMITATAGSIPLSADLSKDAQKEIKSLASKTDPRTIISLIDLVMQRRQEMKSAPIPALPLEMAVVFWCADADTSQSGQSETQNKKPLAPQTQQEEQKKTQKKEPASKPKAATQKKTQETKEVAEEEPSSKPAQQPPNGTSVSKTDIENIWKDFLKKIEQEFPSLVFILNMADIISVEQNTLKLSVQYSFHQDKLTEPRCSQRLSQILSEMLGATVGITATVNEETEKKEDPELRELAGAFGGKVVS